MFHRLWTPILCLPDPLTSSRYVGVGHLSSLPCLGTPAVWLPSTHSGVLSSSATQPRGLRQHPREQAGCPCTP